MNLRELKREIDKLVAEAGKNHTMSEINEVLARPGTVPIDRAAFFWGAFRHALRMKERSENDGICVYKPDHGGLGCLLSPFIIEYNKELEGNSVIYPIVQAAIGLDPRTVSNEDTEFLADIQKCHDLARDMEECRVKLFDLGQKHGFIPVTEGE